MEESNVSMNNVQTADTFTLEDMQPEVMNPKLRRRVITGEKLTISQIWLDEGIEVPMHRHESEQMVHVISGSMEFTFEDSSKAVVKAGQVLVIPPNLGHSAVALEDTEEWDIFAPRREDWLTGNDHYLRG